MKCKIFPLCEGLREESQENINNWLEENKDKYISQILSINSTIVIFYSEE